MTGPPTCALGFQDWLNLQANKNTLLIEGNARIEMPQGMEALYADVRSTLYRRSFVLR
jgi:hypothetical protein